MRKVTISVAVILLLSAATITAYCQPTTITGTVRNSTTQEAIPAVSITIKGISFGTFTDDRGNFKFNSTQKLPYTVVISSVGFTGQEVTVENSTQALNILLQPSYALGEEVVVAASRLPERILESPVTIERVNSAAIRNAPGPNYYDVLGHLKGVDVTTSSLTFKTVSTRGFNGSGNLRFNQLVDGMDNAAPALNFSVGNVIGLTDLDVDNMELLSGASSALYGSGGLNGTLLITSKDPFKYQGFSIQIKQGVMHFNDYRRKASPFNDFTFRWGKKLSDKFAFKIGAEYTRADDWQADDSSNLERNNVFSSIKGGTRISDPNYDGVNIYGDEASASMQAFSQVAVAQANLDPATTGYLDLLIASGQTYSEIQQILLADPSTAPLVGVLPFYWGQDSGIYGTQQVSRTGYKEKDIVNYDAHNLKISGGLYYKISSNVEASLTGNWGEGTTVYTGADRYSLKKFQIGQYKLEFKSPTWFLRAYTTQENSGDSYATTLTALSINNAWKDNGTWFGQYVGTYSAYALQGVPAEEAHAGARIVADSGRYLPGTAEFNNAFNKSVTTPISEGGSQFADKSSVYQVEGQLDLTQHIKVLNVLVGANYRLYNLNSNGTIFADTAGSIKIYEYGTYVQLQKQLLKDVLKLTASGRYDKSENFKGRFTPRVTASMRVAEDNNIRLSYQQAYRFPNNQDQYINLQTPGTILIGGLPSFATFFHFNTNPVYTAQSVVAYQATGDPTNLQKADFETVKPETMESYEIGYRGVISDKLLIDAYFYFSKYKDFIAREAVARGASGDPATSVAELSSPFTTTNYSFVVNSETPVKANGWGVSAVYQMGKGYALNANVYNDELKNVPEGLVTFFNTPKYRCNVGIANSNFYKGIGFNVIYKWQDKVNWQGTFGTGTIPSFSTLDAQVSYNFTKEKILIKLGGTNLINHYYRNAFGNPYVGGLYYVSIGYNIF